MSLPLDLARLVLGYVKPILKYKLFIKLVNIFNNNQDQGIVKYFDNLTNKGIDPDFKVALASFKLNLINNHLNCYFDININKGRQFNQNKVKFNNFNIDIGNVKLSTLFLFINLIVYCNIKTDLINKIEKLVKKSLSTLSN